MKDMLIILFLAASLVCNSCSGQDNKISEQGDTISPGIDSKVNREYDENGNLRRFDSIYTYYYNPRGGNLPDSLHGMFRKHFNGSLFAGDSTFFHDLFKDDPYLKNFFDNDMFFKDPFFDGQAKNDSTDKHVPRIVGPDEYMFNSDRFRQMFRYFDSLNKNLMKRDFDPEKFFNKRAPDKLKKQNNLVL